MSEASALQEAPTATHAIVREQATGATNEVREVEADEVVTIEAIEGDVIEEVGTVAPADPFESGSPEEDRPATPSMAPQPVPPPSVADLVDRAVGLMPAVETADVEAEPLPATPSRDDVERAVAPLHARVAECGDGRRAMVNVQIAVEGSTGRVTSVLVVGQFVGTPIGSCVARAVRAAIFPQFSRARFTLEYPFRL